MPTHYQLALMARAAYDAGKCHLLEGWQLVKFYEERGGLGIAVYKNEDKHEIVISFRGTALDMSWLTAQTLYSDLYIALGYAPNTYDDALKICKELQQQYSGYMLYFTGHSLGGTLAALCASNLGCRAVTFEAAGVQKGHIMAPGYNARDQITAYVTAPDTVNTAHPQLGRTKRLYLQPINKITSPHAISCLWDTTARSFIYFTIGIYAFKKLMGLEAISNPLDRAPAVGALAGTLLAYGIKAVFKGGLPVGLGPLFYVLSTFIGAAPGLREDFGWLLSRHHPMDNIVEAMDSNTGNPKKALDVQSWPTRYQHWLVNMPIYQVKSFFPCLEANRGIHSLNNEDGVIEAQVNSMYGYRVKST